MEYTPEQQNIFKHDPGKHACILAGPGTGKSSTIINYISKIHEQSPEKVIRLLTFTRAANGELVDKIIEAGHEAVISSTVHSFAISVLLNNPGTSGLPEPLRIADDWEWNQLIKKNIAEKLRTTPTKIDKLKDEMSASWESLSPHEEPDVLPEIRARFMGLWEEHRRIFGYTLLAELPFRLKTALEGNSDLNLGNINLIAIDEYQDLNACDLSCFYQLSQRVITILAIGDDDQSIYKFRKAHPAGIRNFSNDYQATTFPLTISHRCGKKILVWANFVIAGDTDRPNKPPLTPSSKNSEGIVRFLVFNRENNEAQGVLRLTNWLKCHEKVPYEEILVLVRTGSIAKLIKEAFKSSNIPFSDPEESLNKLQNDKTRILLSILQLLSNKSDSLAWWTILKLTRGVGMRTVDELYNLAKNKDIQFGVRLIQQAENNFSNISHGREKIASRVNEVLKMIDDIRVPQTAKWGAWIFEKIRGGKLPEPVDGLEDILLKIDHESENDNLMLAQYINQIEPTIKDIMNSKIPGRLRIMNLSRSKGLTVQATIIVGVEKGIIPHPMGNYQEERRLIYVGMTRARDYLFLTRCRRRTGPTARSGRANVAGTRLQCPFLDGGPVTQVDGENELKRLGV